MNCSRKSWTECITSHAESVSTSNPTRQGNPFRGAVGNLDRSDCSAQSISGRNASIPPNLLSCVMDYSIINVQLVIAIYGVFRKSFSEQIEGVDENDVALFQFVVTGSGANHI